MLVKGHLCARLVMLIVSAPKINAAAILSLPRMLSHRKWVVIVFSCFAEFDSELLVSEMLSMDIGHSSFSVHPSGVWVSGCMALP